MERYDEHHITDKQLSVLLYCFEFEGRTGEGPPLKEIAKFMKRSAADHHVDALTKKGMVARKREYGNHNRISVTFLGKQYIRERITGKDD